MNKYWRNIYTHFGWLCYKLLWIRVIYCLFRAAALNWDDNQMADENETAEYHCIEIAETV